MAHLYPLDLLAMSIRDSMRDIDRRLLRAAMLPFKAYIPGAFVAVLLAWFVSPFAPQEDGGWPTSISAAVFYGYVGSTAVLASGALIAAFHTHDKQAMWSALVYAAVGVVIAGLFLGAAFPSPHK